MSVFTEPLIFTTVDTVGLIDKVETSTLFPFPTFGMSSFVQVNPIKANSINVITLFNAFILCHQIYMMWFKIEDFIHIRDILIVFRID